MLEVEKINENLNEIAAVLAETSDKTLIADFFTDILTPAERADIAARWALIKALNKKTPQRTIAKELGVSLCKITRGSKELQKPASAFSRMLDRLDILVNRPADRHSSDGHSIEAENPAPFDKGSMRT
jgi:TrpR family trp operon transcriptional repressor